MTIRIEVTHWHDSDGFSRDDGWNADWWDIETLERGRGSGKSYEEALSKALAAAGLGEIVINRKRDTYEAY